MGLGSRSARHDTVAAQKVAVVSEDYWAFKPRARVMTVDGIAGVVTAVADGPYPGTEEYQVTLDNGMGGGTYTAGQLSPVATTIAAGVHTADQDYPELGTILHDRPPIERIQYTAHRTAAYWDDDGDDHDELDDHGGDDWDDIHSGLEEIHRGLHTTLPHELHHFVHDESKPMHERAHALLEHVRKGDSQRSSDHGLGTHWTDRQRIAEDFADGGTARNEALQNKRKVLESRDRSWGTNDSGDPKGQPVTSVVLHAHQPDRDSIDDHADPMEHGSSSIYGFHEHPEREVPIRPGAEVPVKGISWREVHHFDDEPDDFDDEYKHHEFSETRHHRASLGGGNPFDVRHVETDTGGTKFPRRVDTTAHHPGTGEQVGSARYFPPKRKGGPISIDEVRGHAPGAASAMLNDIEARHPGSKTVFLHQVKRNNNNPDVTGHAHEHAGLPSDWDTHYPNLADTVHRGLSLRLEPWSARTVNSSSHGKEDHLRELHRALGESSAGTHWTEDEHAARLFAHNATSDHRTEIPVVLHAATPARKDIETRRDHLYRGGVFPYGHSHSSENEVPIRKGREVAVTGISWRPDAAHPDADEHGWVHHTYDEPRHHTAAAEPAMGEPMAQEVPSACSSCGSDDLSVSGDNGRNVQATCNVCNATMSSWGGQFTPELIGDPSNHPDPAPDPASGTSTLSAPVKIMDTTDHIATAKPDMHGLLSRFGHDHETGEQHPDREQTTTPTKRVGFAGYVQGQDFRPVKHDFHGDDWEDEQPVGLHGAVHEFRGYTGRENDFERWHTHGEVTKIPLREGNVYATQGTVSDRGITEYLKNPERKSTSGHPNYPGSQRPLFVKHEGNYFTLDGHHRTAAAMLRGDSHVEGHLYDADKHGFPEPREDTFSPFDFHENGDTRTLKKYSSVTIPADCDHEFHDSAEALRHELDHHDDGFCSARGGLTMQGSAFSTWHLASDDDDYRMPHQPPDAEDGSPLHNLSENGHYPEDVYTHPHYYADYSDSSVHESLDAMRQSRGKPNRKVRIYRAMPAEHVHKGIQQGNWVTTSKEYARLHGKHHEDSKKDWPVISATVEAQHLRTDGNDIREYGYHGPDITQHGVAYSGGAEQKVSPRANGSVAPVKRKPKPKETHPGFTFSHYSSPGDSEGKRNHMVVAYDPQENWAGRREHDEDGNVRMSEVEPEHENSGLHERMAQEIDTKLNRLKKARGSLSVAAAGRTLSWDEVGRHYPHVYGDSDEHGDEADGADGRGIGDTANHLAHSRPDDPHAENTSVHDLEFHPEWVDLKHIDHNTHGGLSDPRVKRAYEGYKNGDARSIPPLVVVHRHGVYQVADGHHRAEAAKLAGKDKVPALVAHSPHPDEPFGDGVKGPFYGAKSTVEPEGPQHDHIRGHLTHEHNDPPRPYATDSEMVHRHNREHFDCPHDYLHDGGMLRTGSHQTFLRSIVASLDEEGRWHFTASWSDVRDKAKRLRSEGAVNITVASGDGVGGEVKGDNNVYETVLSYVPGSQKVAYWTCGCKWAAYAWGRSPAYKRFEGRMCSHALAMQFEAQARGMFGKDVEPNAQRPSWMRQRTPVVVKHQRDTGDDLTRRAVPPGNMRRTFEGSLVAQEESAPVFAAVATALAAGEDPAEVMRSLFTLGYVHDDARVIVRTALDDKRCPNCGAQVGMNAVRCPRCGTELTEPEPAELHLGSKQEEAEKPTHAGVVLKAKDTGRILMLQRAMADNDGEPDPNAGRWEFPGGGIESRDHTSLHAAIREFEEEVGQKFPKGGALHHVWKAPGGTYHGHVVVIPEESQVALHNGRVTVNPDDPDGETPEQAAWWEVEHARKNPALREECKKSPWKEIAAAGGAPKTAAAWDALAEFPTVPGWEPPLHSDSENPGSTGFATSQDPPEFDVPDHDVRNLELSPGFLAVLHDEPEPALPRTEGDDHDEQDFFLPTSGAELYRQTNSEISPTEVSALPNQFTGSVDDIVARFQATAGARVLNAGGQSSAGPSDGDIAQAAKAFLSKEALKEFTFQEQQELITEGALDNVMARNVDKLDITDTHYSALEEALAAQAAVNDPDDLFI